VSCLLRASLGCLHTASNCTMVSGGGRGGFRGDLSSHQGERLASLPTGPNPGQGSPGPLSIGKLVTEATVLPIPRDTAGVCWWPTDTIFWRRPLGPADLEMILDSFNPIDPAECLLGHLFLKEGCHVTAQNDAAVGRSFKADFPVRNVGACFKCVGDSLKKSVRCLGFRCLGFHGVLVFMVSWFSWCLGFHGVLVFMVSWFSWCLGFHGVLEVWRDACARGREGSRRQGWQEGWVYHWESGDRVASGLTERLAGGRKVCRSGEPQNFQKTASLSRLCW